MATERTYRRWTTKELDYMRRHGALGADAIAAELGRSKSSVIATANRFRISLRTPGERRGYVLGQPRGVSLQGDLREAALDGRVPESAIAARRELNRPEVCPACGTRDVNHSSGFCIACWRHELAKRHRRELERLRAEHESQKELWTARQQLSRYRQEIAAGRDGDGDGAP